MFGHTLSNVPWWQRLLLRSAAFCGLLPVRRSRTNQSNRYRLDPVSIRDGPNNFHPSNTSPYQHRNLRLGGAGRAGELKKQQPHIGTYISDYWLFHVSFPSLLMGGFIKQTFVAGDFDRGHHTRFFSLIPGTGSRGRKFALRFLERFLGIFDDVSRCLCESVHATNEARDPRFHGIITVAHDQSKRPLHCVSLGLGRFVHSPCAHRRSFSA